MSEFLPQLPFAAFASYPAALSAPNHPYLPPAPSNAPRHSSTEHNTVLQSHPDPRTQPLPLDTRGNQQSGAGRGGGGTASSSSSKGTIRSGLDTDESPPSSPGSIGEGKRPKEEEVVVFLPVAPPAKVPAKRGRKKKPLPEELEAMEDLEDAAGPDGPRKRGRRPSLTAPEKRKLQNRAAQRAFRERKEAAAKAVEDRLVEQEVQLQVFRDMIERLVAENQALRRGEDVPISNYELPPPMEKLNRDPSPLQEPFAQAPEGGNYPSPPDPPLALLRNLALVPAETSSNAYSFSNNAFLPNPSTDAVANQQLPPLDTPSYQTEATNFDLNNFEFDFDAPFDYSSTIPLPPLFHDLFSQSFSNSPDPSSVPAIPGAFGDAEAEADAAEYEACPGDSDDLLPLPNGRLPCDKPECDFSLISCALPIPWRPPAMAKDLASKDVWVCTQAWAKLCSHPLFSDCDVDELCHELRERTLCSDDGRVVISKKDVCDVFRSIPARARARGEMDLLP